MGYYKIHGKRVNLTDKEFRGEGGEATVYQVGTEAVKILKPTALGKMPRVEQMITVSNLFPSNVLAPTSLVTDTADHPAGFTSNFGVGQDLILLAQPNWKAKNGLDNNFVQELFKSLHETVNKLHSGRVLIGDFNYNNILFGTHPGDHFILDVDSMSFEVNGQRYLCTAMHPWFFDPTLSELLKEFKRTSSAPGEALKLSSPPAFTARTDWYSYNVLFFMALMCIHPFKGTHRTLSTEFSRMEARVSVFHPDVVVPKSLIPLTSLNDDLIHHWQKTFEQDYRSVFPLNVLTPWVKCQSCNAAHNRRFCPKCQSGVTAPVAVAVQGKCRADVIFSSKGRIITSSYQDKLRFLYEEGGILKRDRYITDTKVDPNGEGILNGSPTSTMRLTIQLGRTWLGNGANGQLIPIDSTGPDMSGVTSSGMMGRIPMFDSNSGNCYRMVGDHISDFQGVLIGQAIENRTWFKVGEKFGFGFYRAGVSIFPFMWRVGQRGIIPINSIPNPDGKIQDMTCYFGSRNILFAAATEKGGIACTEMHVIDTDNGHLVASLRGEASSQRALASIYGKALFGPRILTTTDDGLMTLEVAGSSLIERSVLADTAPFVASGNEIYVHSPNQVYVVNSHEIKLLTL